MWDFDHKEDWGPKNWCFWTMVLKRSLESPLACKEIKPVNPKGNQYWILFGRTNAKALILWPHDEKTWLIEKDPVERLKAGVEADDRGQDGCMASPTQWTWVWASSRRQWMSTASWHLPRAFPMTEQQQSLSLHLPSSPCNFVSSSYYSNIG